MDLPFDTLFQFLQDYLWWIIIALVIAAVLPIVFFCNTLSKALSRCAPENRDMTPLKIWLLLIPGVNIVWNFYAVSAIASSLKKEYTARGIQPDKDYGRDIGLAMAVFTAASMLPLLFLSLATSLLAAICLSLYWVKIARLSRKLAM